MRVQLTLNEEQTRLVSRACEFYARVRMGQFEEILHNTICRGNIADGFSDRRDLAYAHLFLARNQIYPDLDGGTGHSYGICKFEDADKAFDVHQVIRFAMGGSRPFSYYELPECKRLD